MIRTEKDPALRLKENEAYQNELKKASTPPAPDAPGQPSFYDEKSGTLSDLKKGDRLEVAADTDIKLAASFTATKIIVIRPFAFPSRRFWPIKLA